MLLVGLAAWLASACAPSFLDDFPPYAPAESFLEQREQERRRLSAAKSARAQARATAFARALRVAQAKWRVIDETGHRRIEQRLQRQMSLAAVRNQERDGAWRRLIREREY